MLKHFRLIVLFVLSFDYINAFEGHLYKWCGHKWLDPNYHLQWTTNTLNKEITFKVEVKTKRWFSFGLSKHGRKNEIDKVIGWVGSNGETYFQDYWVCRNGVQSVDKFQDWKLLSALKNSTHTVFQFSRKFVTCDDFNDLEIFESEYEFSNIVYEYGCDDTTDTNKGNITHHGLFHVNLIHPSLSFKPKEKDIKTHDLSLDVMVPSNTAKEFCQIFKLVDLNAKSIIKFETNTSKTSHQCFRLSKCPKEWAENNFERFKDKTFICTDINHPLHEGSIKCNKKFILTSSLRTETTILPDFVGLPLDTNEIPYVMLHGHFINKLDIDIVVKSTFRMWLTAEKRKLEADYQAFGMIEDYAQSNWPFIVPPKQDSFKISSIASSYCLNNDDEMNDFGLFLFTIMFGSHTAETQELRHYRKGQLLTELRIHHNDVNYQPFRHLTLPINFRKTDKLVITCEYNTINKTKSLTGINERCTFLAYYYPKMKNVQDSKFVKSRMAYETMLNITGLEQIDNYNGLIDNTVIRKPVELNNTKLIDFITGNKYRINCSKSLERMQVMDDNYECCSHLFDSDKEICKIIKKPARLYDEIKAKETHKYCPNPKIEVKPETNGNSNGLNMDKFNIRLLSLPTIPKMDKFDVKLPRFDDSDIDLPKFKFSFKLILDTFKIMFQTSTV